MTDSASDGADAPWLVGTWQLLRCERPLEIQPGTRMEFATDSSLVYTIPSPSRVLMITLRWRVADGVLHTEHEDGSNPVQVRVERSDTDVLTFDFDGSRAWFVRAS